MTSVTDRVAAGAAYLDEHDPGWWRADVERAIDLDTLDLFHGDRCILGQRCPVSVLAARVGVTVADESEPDELTGAAWRLAFDAYSRTLTPGMDYGQFMEWACEYAFIAEDTEWDDLTAEWRRVIEARRAS